MPPANFKSGKTIFVQRESVLIWEGYSNILRKGNIHLIWSPSFGVFLWKHFLAGKRAHPFGSHAVVSFPFLTWEMADAESLSRINSVLKRYHPGVKWTLMVDNKIS